MKNNKRNALGLKDSHNQYRNIKGVYYEHWTSDPGEFEAEKKAAKKFGLKTRIINGELFIEATPHEPQIQQRVGNHKSPFGPGA